MFTNIKELLPKRIEALGVQKKITAENIEEAGRVLLKNLLSSNPGHAENVSVKSFTHHTLIIAAKNPQWAARVYLMKEDLRRKLEAQFPAALIQDISIVVSEETLK